MDSFIFNEYTKRFLNGEVNSSQIWHFLPVNKKFVQTFEECSALDFKQFKTTADIGYYSADGLTNSRIEYLKNATKEDNNYTFYDVITNLSGLVTATYSQIKYKKDSDTINKPLYIDNTVDEAELKSLYGIELNDTHKYYKDNGGFYFVTKTSELNWLANRCERNNEFTFCLGDNIASENITKVIGTYEHPFQGTFDGAGFIFSSCNIDVTGDINGVIGILGNNGVVKNVKIKDLTFSSNNLLTTSYIEKYGNDVIAGFVAKNYGEVSNISSIGTNYFYGLSPTIYSLDNKSDDKGDTDIPTVYKTVYLIDHYGNLLFRDEDGYLNFQTEVSTLSFTSTKVNRIYLHTGNNTEDERLSKNDYLLVNTYPYYGRHADVELADWNGTNVYNGHIYSSYSSLFATANDVHDIYNHFEGFYGLRTINGTVKDITGTNHDNNLSSHFNNYKYYYNCDDYMCDVKYIHITPDNIYFDEDTKDLYITADKVYFHSDLGDKAKREKIISQIESGNNVYYNKSSRNVDNYRCIDNYYNIIPYYGYFNLHFAHNNKCCIGYENQAKYTYMISPIVGSNYNNVSGCFNNSYAYFGINKSNEYNPFVGEYGGIVGYNEGKVISNTSNIEIKNYTINDDKKNFKIFMHNNISDIRQFEYELLSNMYDKNLNLKNHLIMGNIIGRNNLYNDNCIITGNLANLKINNTTNFDSTYFRPSTLIGSMYMNTIFDSVSSYNSCVENNTSYIDNGSNASATHYFNELFLNLDEFPNTYHYTTAEPVMYFGTLHNETSADVIKKQNNEITEIKKKYKANNSYDGKCYRNFCVTIPSTSYIGQQFSYLTHNSNNDNHFGNCKYEYQNNSTKSITINNLSYNNIDGDELDNYFDVRRTMIREDYATVNLPSLSANVEFDYNFISFKVKDGENNLCWGTSSNPKEELKYTESITGDVINSKDFAGVLIYDNEGNLVCYENNYNTNVLYNTYSMNYVDNMIMEFH